MPKYWHDRHSISRIEDPAERFFQLSIVADKKPYFMRLVYPALAKQYNTYIKTADRNSVREFGISLSELEKIPAEDRTERQAEFLGYYYKRMPVGTGDCVMNKICRRFEDEFNGIVKRCNAEIEFDYSILKDRTSYSKTEYKAVEKLYRDYRKRLQQFAQYLSRERMDDFDKAAYLEELRKEFEMECDIACPNRAALTNVVLDLCYTSLNSKKFAWHVCGDQIIANLFNTNGNRIIFPKLQADGEIWFCGRRFSVEEVDMEEFNGDSIE